MQRALDLLKSTFGYDDFRGQQASIIESVIHGEDSLVIMPTGGGKSLCYQIPAIVRPGCGIVISPLIALMQDQVEALKSVGINAGFLNSSLSMEDTRRIESELTNNQLELLYIAPERLTQERTINLLQRCNISLFAIDEAHCVSQWGHNFRADYLKLDILQNHFPSIPRIALTATADERTQREIVQRLHLEQAKQFIAGFDRPNIQYRITLKTQPKQQLLRFLKNEHPDHAGIVYCLSRKKTEATAEWLQQAGFNALPYHAGLSADIREENQRRFLREESIIMVATIAFGMGIDKPDVRFVAHLDLPKSVEAYYQETGRAGRDGQPANAWMAYGLQDVIKLKEMMSQNESSGEHQRVEYQKLDAMLGLCEITSCRRNALLTYFGDKSPEKCGNCDTCLHPVETWDGSIAAQKAISCAFRSEQRFGVNHLIDILTGANTQKIQQHGHDSLSVYGIGSDLDKTAWRSVYRQLIARGFLQVDYENYNSIKLNEKCRPLLRGQQNIDLRRDAIEKQTVQKRSNKTAQVKDKDLWEALRQCRTTLAEEFKVPPYVIFHDSTLMEMVELQPTTAEHFSRLNGVGDKKLEKYAPAFIDVIVEFSQRPEWQTDISATTLATYQLLQDNLEIDTIAQQRELSTSTIYAHVATLIQLQKVILNDVIDLDDNEIETIKSALIDHGVDDEKAKLKPVFEHFDGSYNYGVLRCITNDMLLKNL